MSSRVILVQFMLFVVLAIFIAFEHVKIKYLANELVFSNKIRNQEKRDLEEYENHLYRELTLQSTALDKNNMEDYKLGVKLHEENGDISVIHNRLPDIYKDYNIRYLIGNEWKTYDKGPIDRSIHRSNVILFQLVSSDGNVVLDENLTLKYKYLKNNYEERKRIERDLISHNCETDGCFFDKNSKICSSHIKKAQLVSQGETYTLKLDKCILPLFVADTELPFQLSPDVSYELHVTFKNGETISLNYSIENDKKKENHPIQKNKSEWVELDPLKAGLESPALFMRFEGDQLGLGTFYLRTGEIEPVESKLSSEANERTISFVSVDGAGFKKFGGTNGITISSGPSYTNKAINRLMNGILSVVNEDKTETLSITLDTKKIGIKLNTDNPDPWWFHLDLGQVIFRGLKLEKMPSIVCTEVCKSEDRLPFLNVDSILTGIDRNNLNIAHSLDFTIYDHLQNLCLSTNKECSPFFVEFPKNSNRFYTQIIMKDGTHLPIQNHFNKRQK